MKLNQYNRNILIAGTYIYRIYQNSGFVTKNAHKNYVKAIEGKIPFENAIIALSFDSSCASAERTFSAHWPAIGQQKHHQNDQRKDRVACRPLLPYHPKRSISPVP
jgi:hypothetical protein